MPNRHSAPMIADAVVCVAVGLPLVPILGVLGLAVGGVAAAVFHTAILAHAVERQTHVHVFRHIRMPVLAWIVAAGVAWGCAQGPGPIVMRAAISSCVAIGLYLGLLFLTRRELMLELVREFASLDPSPPAATPGGAGARYPRTHKPEVRAPSITEKHI